MAKSKTKSKPTKLFKNPAPGLTAEGLRPQSEEELEFEKEERRLRELVELPHLYGYKWYKWAAEFRDSVNPVNLLCAANQISKSSTAIRKCILWATDQDLWKTLWSQRPVQFWYLYPGKKQVNAEFETKWKQFLPRGEMIDDPYYGYRVERTGADINAIHFNSGVHVYFKTYSQQADALQTGSCDAIFCDEELPTDIFDELMFRVSASAGYFHMVFTATLGQDFWRRAMDPEPTEKEELKDAFKLTVSLYDALYYEDGSPSHWTMEKIRRVEERCSSQNEVLKRVFGKFISITGRKYHAFDLKRHVRPKHPIPANWLLYCGADYGGGGLGHKSALVYVAVRPDFRQARVFLGWEGPSGIDTTAGDVISKHLDIVKENKLTLTGQYYDWNAKDLGVISVRMGTPFEKADKSHERGEEVINTLFKNNMIFIYEDPELMKLAAQLATLKKDTLKRVSVDDIADAFRYAVTKIPWDWSLLVGERTEDEEVMQAMAEEEKLTPLQREVRERRKQSQEGDEVEAANLEEEFDEWNEAYGS